jgi:hypothetical protein
VRGHPDEHAADEIRFALTRRAADSLMASAYHLVERIPAACAALRSGRIDLPKARVLPPSVARQVIDLVLPIAGDLTTGQLRVRLRKLVITADPQAADRRHAQALTRRPTATTAPTRPRPGSSWSSH